MKIDNLINKALSVFGYTQNGDMNVRIHTQNLNEDRRGDVKGWAYHGRGNLHVWRRTFGFSWNLWTNFCGASIGTDDETSSLKFHASLPPVAFWLTVPVPRSWKKTKPFNTFEFDFIEFRVFDTALWWKFWHGESWTRSGRPSKFRQGNFHPIDFILGHQKCETEIVEVKDVQVPMPEGLYPAKAKMEKRVRYRSRWFAKAFSRESISVWLDIPRGIPYQGKGENSWDCGGDGLFGIGAEGPSYERAIARAVESVLTSRRKYGGSTYPNPANRPPPVPPNMDQGEASA